MLYESQSIVLTTSVEEGLNPCSNGICSTSVVNNATINQFAVLILVLMEYALRDK